MVQIFLLAMLSCRMLFGSSNLDDPKEVVLELVKANYQIDPQLTILQLFQVDSDFYNAIVREVFSLIFKRCRTNFKSQRC